MAGRYRLVFRREHVDRVLKKERRDFEMRLYRYVRLLMVSYQNAILSWELLWFFPHEGTPPLQPIKAIATFHDG